MIKAPLPCRPTHIFASFGDIDPALLRERQPELKGWTHDIDGYLMDHDDPYDAIPERHLEVIALAHETGFLQAFITNTGTGPRAERSEELAAYIKQAVPLDDLPVVNSAIEGCSKKPDKSMFEKAAQILGLDPSEICHGGDQMLKDVMGANRAGYGATILTPRYGANDHPGVRFIQRPLEEGLHGLLNLPAFPQSGGWQSISSHSN